MTAVWIALAAVFIALIPAFAMAGQSKEKGRPGRNGGDGGSTAAASDSGSDCGSDGGGGCD
ncbi:hypothetical protein ACPVPU_06040 [Sphingomonas sp. CJ99]